MKISAVEIPTVFNCEGQQIVGVLHFPKNREKIPLIVLVHGLSANKLGTWDCFFVKAAREFSRSGFAVIRFDFRGSGDSEGNFEDQSVTSMLNDLDSVIEQISNKYSVDNKKICLVGHSLGAYVSFLHAINDRRIKCLVSWMGRLSDLKEFWSKVWFEEVERKGYIYMWGYKITRKYVEDSMKYNLRKYCSRLKIPTLFIYGELDTLVPPSEGVKYYKMIRAPKKLVILKNLDHKFSGENVQKQVINITLKWIKKWLK